MQELHADEKQVHGHRLLAMHLFDNNPRLSFCPSWPPLPQTLTLNVCFLLVVKQDHMAWTGPRVDN